MTKIQLIFTKKISDEIYFLCVKRSPEDGGYWNLIVGSQEENEDDVATIVRESFEELGINISNFSAIPNCTFKWNKGDIEVTERSYIITNIEGGILENIKLNIEHTEYKWCKFEEAYELLEKSNNKKCLQMANEKLGNIYEFQEM